MPDEEMALHARYAHGDQKKLTTALGRRIRTEAFEVANPGLTSQLAFPATLQNAKSGMPLSKPMNSKFDRRVHDRVVPNERR